MFRIAGGTKAATPDTWTWYVDAVELRISYDDTPPQHSNEGDNSTGVLLGDTVLTSVEWYDISSSLDTAILRTNESGTWDNRSYYQFSSKPEVANISIDTSGHAGETICWVQWANDTSGNMNGSMSQGLNCFDVPRPYLEVSIVTPSQNQLVANNATFIANATVICRGSGCGNVSGRVRYNASSQDPDTDIPESETQPFYVMNSENPLNCSTNPLGKDEYCNISWQVNATGEVGSAYQIGIIFESVESYVNPNTTGNVTVSIISCILDITLQWDNVSFDPIEPGQRSNATGNQASLYNITVESITTCNVDLYGRADDLDRTGGGGYSIGAGNMSFSNTTNDYSEGHEMSNSWKLFGQSRPSDSNLTTHYWIDVPESLMEGEYNSTLYIEGVEEGDPA
jgi:hypothetical protein